MKKKETTSYFYFPGWAIAGFFILWMMGHFWYGFFPFDSVQYRSEESRQVMALEIQALEGSKGYLWTVKQQVVVCGASGWRKIAIIDRITDGRGGTIYVGKDAFDKYGRLRGGDTWSRTSLEPATEELIREIKADFCKRRLNEFDWLSLPDRLAINLVETLTAKDKRINFKEKKFVQNPEVKP